MKLILQMPLREKNQKINFNEFRLYYSWSWHSWLRISKQTIRGWKI